jgi:hypothetical protein
MLVLEEVPSRLFSISSAPCARQRQIIKSGDGRGDEVNDSASNYEDKSSDALPSNLKIIRGFEKCRPYCPYALHSDEDGEQLSTFLEVVLLSKWMPKLSELILKNLSQLVQE